MQNFFEDLTGGYGNHENFEIKKRMIRNQLSVIAKFQFKNQKFEIFGQEIPVLEQNAYLHMLKEYEIMQNRSVDFRQKIILLKEIGHSTEEAFAHLLEIHGDPYIELLNYTG